MTEETKSRILKVFEEHFGYARTSDIRSRGIHHAYLKQLLEEGVIIRMGHGLYILPEVDNCTALHEALLAVPRGIICMGTALAYHELTTWNPPDIHIAVPRGRKIVPPAYPPIRLFHVTGSIFNLGRQEIEIERGRPVSIYDKERCVCDAVRFRNKIGIDIMKEVLREYMNGTGKNLNVLHNYARKIRIISVLNQYLDVLL